MQAAPLHVYRGSHGTLRDRPRRSIPIPRHYSTFHDILSDSEGDDDYGTILGGAGPLEGVQMNSSLYDAFSTSNFDLPGTLPRAPERTIPSPRSPEPATSWPVTSPPPRSPSATLASASLTSGPAWTGLGGPGSTLSRQSSIRRSNRPHSSDNGEFTAFTLRRRSTMRNSAIQDDGPRDESSTEAPSRAVDGSRSSFFPEVVTRRSFDLGAWMSHRRSFGLSNPLRDELTSGASAVPSPSSSQMWYSMTASASPEPALSAALSRRSSSTDINDDRRQVIAPRLRRGGLRPPESVSLHGPGSPATESLPVQSTSSEVVVPVQPAESTQSETATDVGRPTLISPRSPSPVVDSSSG